MAKDKITPEDRDKIIDEAIKDIKRHPIQALWYFSSRLALAYLIIVSIGYVERSSQYCHYVADGTGGYTKEMLLNGSWYGQEFNEMRYGDLIEITNDINRRGELERMALGNSRLNYACKYDIVRWLKN